MRPVGVVLHIMVLQAVKFLDAGVAPFTEFAQNIDTLFMNRRCETLLVTARDLLKKPLHDLVQVQHF